MIDIHTGLGEVGQLEIFTEEYGTKFERLQSLFQRKTVTPLLRWAGQNRDTALQDLSSMRLRVPMRIPMALRRFGVRHQTARRGSARSAS